MAKLTKQYYMTIKGEKKLNCYHVNFSKEIIKQVGFKETDNLHIYIEDGKLIIEKTK